MLFINGFCVLILFREKYNLNQLDEINRQKQLVFQAPKSIKRYQQVRGTAVSVEPIVQFEVAVENYFLLGLKIFCQIIQKESSPSWGCRPRTCWRVYISHLAWDPPGRAAAGQKDL